VDIGLAVEQEPHHVRVAFYRRDREARDAALREGRRVEEGTVR
jgi:hypothetical protein